LALAEILKTQKRLAETAGRFICNNMSNESKSDFTSFTSFDFP
jgi:hypothetical protein